MINCTRFSPVRSISAVFSRYSGYTKNASRGCRCMSYLGPHVLNTTYVIGSNPDTLNFLMKFFQGVEDDVNGESRERRYHLVLLHSEHPAYLYEDILQFFYRICHAMLFLVLSFWCIVVLSERCIVALSERFIESLVGKVEHCDVAAAVAKRRKEVALAVGMQGEYPSHLLLAAAVGR